MHELSIAMSVLDFVEEEAARRNGAVVKAVHIQIGALSGVLKQALASAFTLAREGTPLVDCEIVIDEVPVLVQCKTCGTRSQPPSFQCIQCGQCGGSSVEVVGGQELEVTALEIES